LSLSDRIALLHEGRLDQIGPPDQIYNWPASRFAAEFMGIPNIFQLSDTKPEAGGTRCQLDTGNTFFVTSPVNSSPARFLAVRPENIRVSHRSLPTDNCKNVMRGRVRQARYLGSSVLWNVEVNSVTWIASEVVNGSGERGSVSLGDEVYLSWEPSWGVLVP
jgi:ABC-type Fe3+/spermidine/putrescine transport system ATPase subunit